MNSSAPCARCCTATSRQGTSRFEVLGPGNRRSAPAMATRKLEKQSRPAAEPRDRAASVFLNIPYDAAFENLLLAYIAGISAFGFTPRATLEIPFGQRRLDRILALIRQSKYSIHDLSRVQLDRKRPANSPVQYALRTWAYRGVGENGTFRPLLDCVRNGPASNQQIVERFGWHRLLCSRRNDRGRLSRAGERVCG